MIIARGWFKGIPIDPKNKQEIWMIARKHEDPAKAAKRPKRGVMIPPEDAGLPPAKAVSSLNGNSNMIYTCFLS